MSAIEQLKAAAERELSRWQPEMSHDSGKISALQGRAERAREAAERACEVAEAAGSKTQELEQHANGLAAQLESTTAVLDVRKAAHAQAQQQAERLQGEVRAAEAGIASAEAQLQQRRQALLQAQAARQGMEASVEGLMSGQAGRAALANDRAVAELAQRSASGRMRGTFHGRLCNVACVSDAAALTAVNAVVSETCNPATTFVVSDRGAAADVVQHFSTGRIGLATCLIAAEARAAAGSQNRRCSLPPLMGCLSMQQSADGCLRRVLEARLGAWHLAPDRQAGLAEIERLKRGSSGACSIVTLAGELFKADGEVVVRRAGRRQQQAYLLAASMQPLGAHTAAASEEDAAELRRAVQDLKAQEQTSLVCMEEAETALARLKGACKAKDEELGSAQGQLSSKAAALERAQAAIEQAQREVATAQRQLEAARSKHQELCERAAALCERSAQAQRAWEAACGSMDSGSEAVAAQARLAELAAQYARAAQSHASLQQALRRIQRRRRALAAAGKREEESEEAAGNLAQRAAVVDTRMEELAGSCKRARSALKRAKDAAGACDAQLRAATRCAVMYALWVFSTVRRRGTL
jgi:chromosome segregation ATPase